MAEFRKVFLPVEHRLIQMGNAQTLGDVESEKFGQFFRSLFCQVLNGTRSPQFRSKAR